jgi:hypothetical protein
MEALDADYGAAAARPIAGINYERLYDYRFRDVDQAGRQAVWREIASYVHSRMDRPQRILDPAAGRDHPVNGLRSGRAQPLALSRGR